MRSALDIGENMKQDNKISYINKSSMGTYLTFSAIGIDKTGVIAAIAKTAKQCESNMLSNKLSVAGDNFAMITHFSGTWHAIAKLEACLVKLAQKHEWQIQLKRSEPKHKHQSNVPYYIQVITLDRVGILHELTNFFARKGILVDELQCDTFIAPKTDTVMANIHFNIYIPVKTNIALLRESFLIYSEEHNLDVVMEPLK